MANNINSNAVRGRLQTPVSGGTRKDIYLVTTSDEVLVPNGTNDANLLTDVLGNIDSKAIEVGTVKPSHPAIWFRVNRTD